MKIVFFGTPDYVIPVLDKLNKYHEILAVVTQPPKPVGKNKELKFSAVDTWAHKKKIEKLFDFKDLPEADLGILASYGNLIPKEVINSFPLGILVIHPSLLPQFRWSNPIRATLVTGTNPTGVSIFKMNEKWDEGPILTQFEEEVLESDTNETLRDRLFEKSAEVLVQMLPAYKEGKIKLKPQDDTKATYAKMITKDDGFIPFEFLQNAMTLNSSSEKWEVPFIKGYEAVPNAIFLNRFIKAMKPWPVAWTKIKIRDEEKRMKILDAQINPESGYLELNEVQLEGKKPTPWNQFNGSYNLL